MIKYWLILCCVLAFGGWACSRPNTSQSMTTPQNPLLCDTASGTCAMPETAHTANPSEATITPETTAGKPVKIIYFTDPICSSCWGIEPQLRRLKLEYGAYLDIEYRMGGLLPSWEIYNSGGISKPSDVAQHWDEASAYYQMPIDGDVWLQDPLPSSYPPSVAFKAAQMQDGTKAIAFMRRLREMVFLEKKNITKPEHIATAATQSGLDAKQLAQDIGGKAQTLFEQDLALGRQMSVRGFPTMFFTDADGNRLTVYGFRPYEAYVDALKRLYPTATAQPFAADWESLFAKYPTLSTQEFAVLTGSSFAVAQNRLLDLFKQNKLRQQSCKNGVLWIK
ncbi:Predicted dithiol-disulfide isomerase, DsbA family [Flexibacter flexilis DSM 6793]|uniref:Predicted dithiol-disulfide isomerase, DsbA family n=1 Tax=Flexibacter flexilis DSM 6793 TaxID=927664 RepID=A0A1I1LUQ8_9BACT|nr:ClpXP adapter SpxH family protein [Flexibacter flexilis]SFC76819.1 Predicted dithiol-disulfide isomerase, DsbA family [Flexibacter flexilis DSM 6793]